MTTWGDKAAIGIGGFCITFNWIEEEATTGEAKVRNNRIWEWIPIISKVLQGCDVQTIVKP